MLEPSNSLDNFFNPKSIAVIGASKNKGGIGYTIFNNLKSSFNGEIYAVNPKYDKLQEIKCYKNVQRINESIDLALIATPARTIPSILLECGQKGITAAIIYSAGFKEVGEEGKIIFDEIEKISKEKSIRIIGPNCIGIINPLINLNAGFYSRDALVGNIAFISQSGALSASILDWSVDQNIGFSSFVSVGSMMDVGFSDLISYFGEDKNTSCILIYIESLKDAARFKSAVSKVNSSKPIIVIKAGTSNEGAKAALSHTGSMTGNDKVYDTIFEKLGIIRVDTIQELFQTAQGFASQDIPKGKKLCIVTNAGGPAILATDYLIENGGELADLSPKTITQLNEFLPAHWSKNNPIDVLGDASDETYAKTIQIADADENNDAILAIFTTQGVSDPTKAAQALVNISDQIDKPIFACWMGEADVLDARNILEAANIPNYRYPESAVNVFLKMAHYNKIQTTTKPVEIQRTNYDTKAAQQIIDNARKAGRSQLNEIESKSLLRIYKIPTTDAKLATDIESVQSISTEIGYPQVMKIISPDIAHKLDVGGVVLNINNVDEAKTAYHNMMQTVQSKLPNATINGVLIEEMVHKKFELIIGAIRDVMFGPVLVFGMGGSLVELWDDTQLAIPPLSIDSAKKLMSKTKAFQLIAGYRGMPSVDIDELASTLVNFSYLISELPQLEEIDINPFSIDQSGGLALDAHMTIKG